MTLPDHVADYLESHPTSADLITNAVHQRMAQTMTTREMLEAAGFQFTEESRAWAREALRKTRLTPEQRAESRRRLELLEAGQWPEGQQ
jgi:hypothetical protein